MSVFKINKKISIHVAVRRVLSDLGTIEPHLENNKTILCDLVPYVVTSCQPLSCI